MEISVDLTRMDTEKHSSRYHVLILFVLRSVKSCKVPESSTKKQRVFLQLNPYIRRGGEYRKKAQCWCACVLNFIKKSMNYKNTQKLIRKPLIKIILGRTIS